MAIKASASITLSSIRDLQSCTRYYLLQSSTLAKPSKPTTKPPGGSWVTAEPTYTAGSTNSLYFCDLNVFSDGDYAYSDVSLSSSYEAAKAAWNKAQTAQDAVDNLDIGGRNLIIHTLTPDVTTANKYPRLLRQSISTAMRSGSVTAAEHGVRTTASSAVQPYIIFGSTDYSSGTLNGLDAGKTYTLSFDYACKLFSAATSGTMYFRVYCFTDSTDGTAAYGGSTAAGLQYASMMTYSAASGNYGSEYNGHCDFTFTLRENATRMYIKIAGNNSTNALYASGDYIEVSNLMLVEGNASTGYAPAPEDLESGIDEARETAERALNSVECIVGTQTASTNAWTGKASFATLQDGQTILYWLPYAGTSSSATLNLALSGGGTTGAKNVYVNATTRCTTHISAGNMIQMVYRVNAAIGSGTYTGWWISRTLNENTYDRIRFNNVIKAKTAITASRVIVGDSGGYFHLVAGSTFNVDKPILWAGSAISAAATGSNNYLSYPSCTLRNNAGSSWTATQYETLYLAGKLIGNSFVVASENWLTTAPADEALTYISLGYMYSTYQMYFYPEHPMFRLIDGELTSISQIAYEAQVAADTAQATADGVRADFKRVVRIDNDGLHVGDNQNTHNEVLIDSEAVNVVTGGVMESKFAGSYIQFGLYQLRRTADNGLAFKVKEG